MGSGLLTRLLHRLTADDDALDAEALTSLSRHEGASLCADAELGARVLVAGRLRSVVYTPSENVPVLSAELYDGSGSIRLVWLGRRRITGIEPGRVLSARGRLTRIDAEPTIFNPWYELQAA